MGIDLTQLTPAQVEKFIHLQATVARQGNAATKVQALREYYGGEHPILLSTRQKEFLGDIVHGDVFPFAHNLVRSIIDTLSERLSVQGVAVNGVSLDDANEAETVDENGATAQLLWEWWKDNRTDLKEQKVYTASLRDGASYVMVDYDQVAQRPRFTVHMVDDGSAGIQFHRDPSDADTVLFATRYFWETDPEGKQTERKTVYLPGEIRKYKRAASVSGWEQVRDEGDTMWPLPWRDSAGEPLGVAVVEFANPGATSDAQAGESEIAQVIGLQNFVNKAWLDLVAAADASGFPILVAEYADGGPIGGGSGDDDLEGGDEVRISPGRMLEISGGTIHRIEAANLLPMLETIWAGVAAISGVSRTPQYYLRPVGGGDVPSGESLKQLESGLVARAVKRQRIFGQSWEDVLHLALRVYAAFGPGTAGEAPRLEMQWADAETRNEGLQAQVAEAHKRLNVPDVAVWAQLGYTPEEINEFQRVARADRAADMATIAAALRTAPSPAATSPTQNGQNAAPITGDNAA